MVSQDVQEIIDEVEDHGYILYAHGGRIHSTALPGDLPPDLCARIGEHKAALLEHLSTQDPLQVFMLLAAIEPALGRLLQQAQDLNDTARPSDWCASDAITGKYSSRLESLAGWYARNPGLRTEAAYDIAVQVIYDALPPCGPDCRCCPEDIEPRWWPSR